MPSKDIPADVWQALRTISKWKQDGSASSGKFRYRAHAKVSHVEDGDTWSGSHKPDPQVTVERSDEVWYRLSRVDTHETDAQDSEKRKKAKREKQFVEDWVKKGKQNHNGEWPFIIQYESQDFEGTYGRLLVDLVRKCDGAELNDSLLSKFGDDIRYKG